MAEQRQKNDSTKRRIPIWFMVLVLVLLGFALFGDRGVLRVYRAYLQKTDLEAKIDRLEKDNDELRKEITALRSDLKTIENIARRELGMVRPDEQVYQFHPRETLPAPPPAPEDGEAGPGAPPDAGRVDTHPGGR